MTVIAVVDTAPRAKGDPATIEVPRPDRPWRASERDELEVVPNRGGEPPARLVVTALTASGMELQLAPATATGETDEAPPAIYAKGQAVMLRDHGGTRHTLRVHQSLRPEQSAVVWPETVEQMVEKDR